MALSNIHSYRQIERMGMIDMLTGLQNRNCYENALEDYAMENVDSLCCLYMDANGLHELNNILGHAAGDEMLIYIGNSLKMLFGLQDSYRIGGDECVVFCKNHSPEEVEEDINRLKQGLASREYHVSLGQAWLSDAQNVRTMVSMAEKDMYEEKRQYYQKEGNVSKARMMNRKLEKILLEKKDADTFLNIISTRFTGVYVVEMKQDLSRVILALLDYDSIRQQLVSDKEIKYQFRKKDGTKLTLRIYPAEEYDFDHSHTVWLFEEDPA